jgi:hypothetical protein
MTYHRPDPDQSIEERFDAIVSGMQALDGPFSWRGLAMPPTPVVKRGSYSTWFNVKYPIKGLSHATHLVRRNREYLSDDHAATDDTGRWELTVDHPQINYRDVVHRYLAELATAHIAYRAIAYTRGIFFDYEKKHDAEYQRLIDTPGINVNGRNNIFTLHPAQYWDAELCGKALGFGPDEVIRRLDGQVPLVRPLMDGVYTVFNDDPDLSFADFCAFNDRFKPVLGLA